MQIVPTALPGVLLVRPAVHRDARGHLLELSNDARVRAAGAGAHGLPTGFVQANLSHSTRGVVRGLHFQHRVPQGKLVSVAHGAIWDVAVDVRRGSPTFGRWVAATLDAADPSQLWIPPGFAHGFAVLTPTASVVYQCTAPYDPGGEGGVRWDDPAVGIAWPVTDPLLSPKDLALPGLDAARADLPTWDAADAPAGAAAR